MEIVEAAMMERPHGWGENGPPEGPPLPLLGRDCVEVRVKYAQYLERQEQEVMRMHAKAQVRIPDDFDFVSLNGLSAEEVEKLSIERPTTLEQASRIPGVTRRAMLYLHREINGKPEKKTRRQLIKEL